MPLYLRLAIVGAIVAAAWNFTAHPEELHGSAESIFGYAMGSVIGGGAIGAILGFFFGAVIGDQKQKRPGC